MDIRDMSPQDLEEFVRSQFDNLLSQYHFAHPVQVQAQSDGHVAVVTPTVKRALRDPVTGATTYQSLPQHVDVPVHFAGGGGVTATHPVAVGDEGIVVVASRNIDNWHQAGGTQQPLDNRMQHPADAMLVPGVRSTPRKLQQVSTTSHQVRSDDKLHVSELHPQTGAHVKSADPSTPPASPQFDPFAQATKFFEHLVHPTSGVAHNATDGGTTHSYALTHELGHVMAVLNGLHSVMSHPDLGALLSAAGGAHTVNAHPEHGVKISSTVGHIIDAPSTSVGGAMSVVGALSGSSGAFDSMEVAGEPVQRGAPAAATLTSAGLVRAASDAAAALQGVPLEAFYLCTGAVAGFALLAVRQS